MIKDTDFERMRQGVTGDLSPNEMEALHAWVDADAGRRATYDELATVWRLAKRVGPHVNAEDALGRFQDTTRALSSPHAGGRDYPGVAGGHRHLQREGGRHQATVPVSFARFRHLIAGIAVAGVAAIALFIGRGHIHDVGVSRTYATTTGQRAMFTLDDGTRVTLAPQTKLHLIHFGRNARTIAIEGEAFLDVVHADGAPFTVLSGQSTTRVLGTSFLVRHYTNESAVHVAVVTGKVSVQNNLAGRPAMTLTAGNVADVSDSTVLVRTAQNIDDETGWLKDELVFDDTPATRVLDALTRWYGYQFRYTDTAIVRQNVRAWVNTQSSEKALATLKQVLNVDLRIVGDTVTLIPQARRATPERRSKSYDVWTPNREVGR